MSHLGPGQVQQIGSVTLVLAERNLTERSVPVFCVGIFWNTTGLKKEKRQNYYSDDAKGKLVIKKQQIVFIILLTPGSVSDLEEHRLS